MATDSDFGTQRTEAGNRISSWVWRLVGTPHRSNIRPVYVVENQDWLAPKSNLSDSEAYEAIVALYKNVSSDDYDAAMANLKEAQPPQEDAHT